MSFCISSCSLSSVHFTTPVLELSWAKINPPAESLFALFDIKAPKHQPRVWLWFQPPYLERNTRHGLSLVGYLRRGIIYTKHINSTIRCLCVFSELDRNGMLRPRCFPCTARTKRYLQSRILLLVVNRLYAPSASTDTHKAQLRLTSNHLNSARQHISVQFIELAVESAIHRVY